MGRLPPVVFAFGVLASLSLVGCEKDSDAPKAPPPTSRNEAVEVAGLAAATSVAAPKAPEHDAPKGPRAPRKICENPPPGAGKTLPKEKVEHLESAPNEALASLPRHWTWVNLWASWCGPCKAEIPRLLAWQSKFAQAGSPVALDFISLDDDKKQGQAFLSSQPEGGLRSSYWLSDGPARARFLSAVKVPEGMALPVHLLFDSMGALRCQIEGDVDESDYAQLAALFSKP